MGAERELKTDCIVCPECGGGIALKSRSKEKGLVNVYGRNGSSEVRHLEYRDESMLLFYG